MKHLLRTDGVRLSRREFARRMTALGIGLEAAGTFIGTGAAAEQAANAPLPAGSRIVEGTGAELLVEQLCAAGEKYIFNCESSGTGPIWDAIIERNDVEVIMAPHEAGTASIAYGYALASHHVPLTICDSSGFLNKLTPMAAAWFSRIPIVIGTERQASTGFGGAESFEDFDQFLEPAAPLSKWRWTIDAARRIPEHLRRAYQFATNPPSGPVALAFPNDLLEQDGVRAEIIPLTLNPAQPIAADPALIEEAARLLLDARSPVLVAGPEIARYDAERQVVELAETIGMPGTCLKFNGNYCPFPTRHALFIGPWQRRMRATGEVDVMLFLGGRMPPGGLPRGVRIIQISTDARMLGRERPSDVRIVADPRHAATALTQALRAMATRQQLHGLAAPRVAAIRSFMDETGRTRQIAYQNARRRSTIGWEVMFAELERTLDRDAILVQETAPVDDPMLWFDFGRDHKTLITPHAQQPGSLGMGLGAALGTKLAEPDRQVVLLAGDGGMLFTQIETLWSAARYRVPVVIVVFNNRSYDMPRRRKLMDGGRQLRLGRELTSYLGDPDVSFAKAAEAFGVKGETISTPGEIGPALQRAIRANQDGEPYLIDAIIERRGLLADSTWHSPFTVAGLRRTI